MKTVSRFGNFTFLELGGWVGGVEVMARPASGGLDVELMRGGALNRVGPRVDTNENEGGEDVEDAAAAAGPAPARQLPRQSNRRAPDDAAAAADPFDIDEGAAAEGPDDEPVLDAASALVRGPPIPGDSEPHEIRYLGRTVVKNTEDHPPDGRTCSTVVQFLRGLSKRKRGAFLGNAAEKQNLVVSAERGTVTCIPAAEQTDALPSGLRISLLHITTVADIGTDVCVVSGRVRPGVPGITFSAYVFVAESPFAARYLVEQVVQACRYAFMIGRMQQAQEALRREAELQARIARGSLPAVRRSPGSRGSLQAGVSVETATTPAAEEMQTPAPPRQVNEKDRAFYNECKILHTALARSERLWCDPKQQAAHTPLPTRIASNDRGDGLWYTCCRNLGKCNCDAH
eukprot:m.369316 g.369316  ORF g.369316 m.369316 type:complete len:401 (+) comp28120_c0_seq2:10977-12179(+)